MKIFIKKKTLTTFFFIIGAIVLVGLFIYLVSTGGNNTPVQTNTESVIMENGKQILLMNARAGYTPNSFNAKANTESILRVTTENTFDCSATVNIPSLNIRQVLPITGITDINLGTPKQGTIIYGTCGAGLYKFTMRFT